MLRKSQAKARITKKSLCFRENVISEAIKTWRERVAKLTIREVLPSVLARINIYRENLHCGIGLRDHP